MVTNFWSSLVFSEGIIFSILYISYKLISLVPRMFKTLDYHSIYIIYSYSLKREQSGNWMICLNWIYEEGWVLSCSESNLSSLSVKLEKYTWLFQNGYFFFIQAGMQPSMQSLKCVSCKYIADTFSACVWLYSHARSSLTAIYLKPQIGAVYVVWSFLVATLK